MSTIYCRTCLLAILLKSLKLLMASRQELHRAKVMRLRRRMTGVT
ncbi:hypothetical protein LT85_4307 [Collimonas arenae]|uniref:Uncharacterized protein n=1 Tax=Collimonas arenae TaxID=279058 RepID=A0A0A1FID1_9BURK|nr:hypothetical protein LT85_4307 [Collimonas arenae]